MKVLVRVFLWVNSKGVLLGERAYVFNMLMITIKLPSSKLSKLKVVLGTPNLKLVSEVGGLFQTLHEISKNLICSGIMLCHNSSITLKCISQK